jgi:hypothetical protein
MKQFCKYSGLVLQQSTYLNNLGLPHSKLLRPGEELVFRYTIFDILHMATHKPPEKMAAVQRYLLAVAMLHATGTVKIKFPFSRAYLTDSIVGTIYPILIESCIRIASNRQRWMNLLESDRLPTIENRADNWNQINWPAYCKEILLPNTALLLFKKLVTAKEETQNKLNDEIELERELRKTLTEHRQQRGKFTFTPAMGKAVLRELNITLAREDRPTLSSEYMSKCMQCFSSKEEQQKVGAHFVEQLRELIYLHVKVSYDSEDSILRTQVSLTLGFLDNLLDYFNSLAALFGGITVNKPAKLPDTSPAQYTVRTVVQQMPFPEHTLTMPAVNSNLEKSTNPMVQKLLAKKAAELAAQKGEG